MGRRKPFSNKQKKAQLQSKRQKKRDQNDTSDFNSGDDPFVVVVPDNIPNEKPKQIPQNRNRNKKSNTGGRGHPILKKLPADLRTVFEKEPQIVIDKRKLESEVPIIRGNEEKLRTQDTHLYSAVIDLPRRPRWDSSMSTEEVCIFSALPLGNLKLRSFFF